MPTSVDPADLAAFEEMNSNSPVGATPPPELTSLAQQRILDAQNAPPYVPTKLPYLTYDQISTSNETYDPSDFAAVGQRMRDNALKAIAARFPLEEDGVSLSVENLAYDNMKNTRLADEKRILQEGGTLADRLRGDWVLKDADGTELQRKRVTLASIPRMTRRGLYIRKGANYGLKHMFRLRPGVYSRIKGNGIIAAHINPEQGSGRQMSLELDPSNGALELHRGTRKFGLLPLLRAAGVQDDVIKEAWGEELFDMNSKKYARLLSNRGDALKEYEELWNKDINPVRLDPETTEITLGKGYENLSQDALLDASKKILTIARTGDDDDLDDRDGLQFQRVLGPADYIAERIVRDGGGIAKNALRRAARERNLDGIEAGIFQPHVDSVFLEDRHAFYPEESSPLESLDSALSVTRIGEGGIGSTRAAPEESRGVQDSYPGFVDPLRCYDDKTEIMTFDGWKLLKNVKPTDALACRKGSKVFFAPADKMNSYHYEGDLCAYDGVFINYAVTPNHRMLAKPAYENEYAIYRADKMPADVLMEMSIPRQTVGEVRYEPGEHFHQVYCRSAKEAALVEYDLFLRAIPHLTVNDEFGYIVKPIMEREARLYGDPKNPKADGEYLTIPYNGEVYCPSVPGGLVYVRREGSCGFWCGNSPEGSTVGLSMYLTYGVRKDDKGNLYSRMRTSDGDVGYVGMDTAAKGIVAMPEYYDPQGDPNEFIPTFYKGKGLEYVPRKEIDFYIANTNNLMSLGTGTIPLIGGIRSNRTMLGSKYGIQANSINGREAPLIRRALELADGSLSTTEEYLGSHLGAQRTPVAGTVLSVDEDEIIVRGEDGKKHTIDLYNETPTNQYGVIHNTPTIAVGDKVSAGQLVATSNYTDENGVAALGTNLRVAYMTGPNASTFEDSIAVNEETAKTKLASTRLYTTKGAKNKSIEYNKKRFLSLFPVGDFSKEQLDKIDENGVVKKGATLYKGDPIYLGIQMRDKSTKGLARTASVPYMETWQHDYPGEVVDISDGKKNLTAYIKATRPLQTGDKLCFDDRTEVFTDSGWKLFKDVDIHTDRFLTFDYKSDNTYMAWAADSFSYFHEGDMYSLETKQLDICVTDNHRHLVSRSRDSAYMVLQTSKEVFGRHVYHFTGVDPRDPGSFAYSKAKGAKERCIKYRGMVYCVEIPYTHTLYVRRNGKTVWSGNSNRYGAKGVGTIIPASEMPIGEDGKPVDILQSPLGLVSRTNTSQLSEAQAGKVARLTGVPVVLPDFLPDEDLVEWTADLLKKHGLKESESMYDPTTGKTIPEVQTGTAFYYIMKHQAEGKGGARSTGAYSSEGVPLKGGKESSRTIGGLELGALLGGGGDELMRDAKVIRGQRNDEFWRAYRNGEEPPMPDRPEVHDKFFAHLKAAGALVQETPDISKIYMASDADIKKLTGGRRITEPVTYDAKHLRPTTGGLFDPSIFGPEGTEWGYFELPEPVLNPLAFKPVAHILGWKDKELTGLLDGSRRVGGKVGIEALQELLGKYDVDLNIEKSRNALKSGKLSMEGKDQEIKRLRALIPMQREGKKPADFLLSRMPILPPVHRPVSALAEGVNLSADINFMYKRMMDASEDLQEAKKVLTEEELIDARKSLYNAVGAVVGTEKTTDPKLSAKGVGGLLDWAFGKRSPKTSALHRKVFGASVDIGGRGVITPDNSFTIDEIGLPENAAWKIYEPMVVRDLRQRGFSLLDAVRATMDKTPDARQSLETTMSKLPVMFNRAPTLWEYGILGHRPRLTEGDSIRLNPGVTKVLNADHDGDAGALHVPISRQAVEKVYSRMLPSRRPLSPADNKAHFLPFGEFVQGLALATGQPVGKRVIFDTEDEMLAAMNKGTINVNTPVTIRYPNNRRWIVT